MPAPHPQTLTTLIPLALIVLVVLLRVRGMRRARRLRLGSLWIVPAVLALLFALSTAGAPPRHPIGWLWLALALGVGAAIGWRRGKLMRISVDPASGTLNQQASPAALLFIVLLIAARQGLRYEALSLGIDVATVTGVLIAFAVGLVAATRAEMYIRAKRLLDAAQNPSPSGVGPTNSR